MNVQADSLGDDFQFKPVGEVRFPIQIGLKRLVGGDDQAAGPIVFETLASQMPGFFHLQDQHGQRNPGKASHFKDFHHSVVGDAFRRYIVAASVISAVGGDHRGKVSFTDLALTLNAEPASLFVSQKVSDHARIKAHGPRDPFAVNKKVVICHIRIDPETGHVDAVPVIDPDDVHLVDTVFHTLHAGPAEIVSGPKGDEGEDVFRPDNSVQHMVDGSVSADGRDDIVLVPEAGQSFLSLFRRLTDNKFIVASQFFRHLTEFFHQFVAFIVQLKTVDQIYIVQHVCRSSSIHNYYQSTALFRKDTEKAPVKLCLSSA